MDAKPNYLYMRIALRFLKETRLLKDWKGYLERVPSYNRHWSNFSSIDFIFSTTWFSRYIIKEKLKEKTDNFVVPIFTLFAYWLIENGYDKKMLSKNAIYEIKANEKILPDIITVDAKNKKTTINWDVFPTKNYCKRYNKKNVW